MLVTELNMPITDLNSIDKISLTIDGADEVDPQLRLIKGGGGALLQEKIVAAASEQFIVIVDSSKLVQQLGKFLFKLLANFGLNPGTHTFRVSASSRKAAGHKDG